VDYFRGSRDPTRIGHKCELALRDALGTDRQLLIAQDELALTRETSVHAAEGSFRATRGLDALNGQSSSNSNEFQVICRKGVALYILDVQSARRL
jgi:hypothetical protein